MDSSDLKDLGNNEFRNGNYQSAIKYFDEAIEKDSDNHILYSNRSAAYLSSGNGQKAFEDADKCVNLEPTWAKGYGRRGAALHMLKKYEEAISSFEEGLKLESDNSYLKSGLELVKNEKDMTINQPTFSMDMMQQLMQNPKIQEKIKDPQFVTKMMQYQSNPLGMLQDSEMMEIFSSIMQEMGNKNDENAEIIEIMSDDEDTDEDTDDSELGDSDIESVE
jgi:stress-induced-phosphoprotein 1